MDALFHTLLIWKPIAQQTIVEETQDPDFETRKKVSHQYFAFLYTQNMHIYTHACWEVHITIYANITDNFLFTYGRML